MSPPSDLVEAQRVALVDLRRQQLHWHSFRLQFPEMIQRQAVTMFLALFALAHLQVVPSQIVYISGTLTGNAVVNVGSNTSVVGIAGSLLSGIGLRILNSENVIVRNVRIAKVLADTGDAIGIQSSSKVWVDHTELSSDLDHDKDYYDGLLDITHGSNAITVTYTILSNSWKGSTVGHSDANGDEDKAFTVSYGLNHRAHLNNRVPTVRFGTVHIFNNYFLDNNDGCNVRNGAQVLLENNVWEGCLVAVFPTNGGQAVLRGNDYGAATPTTTTTGTFVVAPYNFTLLPTSQVKAVVLANAGQKLTC
ncbi:polysaccharide lyase family 1 protein [Auriculariales sp. MPI-PUGE-AT-0066]|nr:polysaccharide lyase family 1 protein [Auriculariales sp. MPI-PUGE-AT-0066]